MKLLVLGASGRTGGFVVRRALEVGHTVTSFGRRRTDAAGVKSVVGAFGDDSFATAVREAEAVISCLASTNKSPTCSTATRAALAANPSLRFVCVAGAALSFPTDQPKTSDRVIGTIMKLTMGRMLADREAERDMLVNSNARWTILRPPRLVQGRATGRWAFADDRPHTGQLDRDDLARAILSVLGDPAMIGASPFVFQSL